MLCLVKLAYRLTYKLIDLIKVFDKTSLWMYEYMNFDDFKQKSN